jgi:hypothetical protein
VREFLAKLNSNKALKFIFVAGVAIVIWLIGMLLFPPEKPQDVPANIIITQKAEGVATNKDDKYDKNISTDEPEVREKLNDLIYSKDSYILVYTFQEDVDFNQEFIEKTLRPKLAQDMLDKGLYSNVSLEQFTANWKLKELEKTSKKTAFFEEGTVKGDQYAAVYVQVGYNFVYGAIFGSPDESHELIVDAAYGVNDYVNDYIQQAREAASKEG